MKYLEIVEKALQNYNCINTDAIKTKLLRALGNWVVKVEADKNYVLRICQPDKTTQRLIVELEWLQALQQESNLTVPQPVMTRTGEVIIQIADRLCVMFDWIEGEPVSRTMSSNVAVAIALAMAQLHQHALVYSPKKYVGPKYDLNWLCGADSWWQTQARDDVGNQIYCQLVPAIEKAEDVMSRLGEGEEQFGLIHSDLHFANVLKSNEGYAVIDFEGCALGHFLFDLAVTEMEFMDYSNGEMYIRKFRETYSKERGIAINDDNANAFKIAVGVAFLEWVFTDPNPKVRQEKSQWIPETIQRMIQLAA